VLALGTVAAPRSARAQSYADSTLFSVNNVTTIYTVNRLTGAGVGVGTLLFAAAGLARDPLTGRLYYTSASTVTPNGQVAYWDPATGTNILLNSTGLNDVGVNDNVVRLAFDQSGVLYGIGASASTLYRIDRTTGAYTSVGTVRVGSTAGPTIGAGGDMAFDYDGTLYVIALDATNNTSLYTVSLTPTSGVNVATAVGTVGAAAMTSLAFGADGRLYVGATNKRVYVISKTGGASTQLATGSVAFQDFASSTRFADLSGTVTTPGLPIGGNTTYSITISNAGPQSANGQVTVVDSLPVGVTYQSVSGAGWSCSAVGRRVTCTTAGPIASGAASTFVLSVAVASTVSGTVTNVAEVIGSTIDQVQANDRFTVSTTAVPNVAFTLVKRHTGSFTVGINGVYTLVARNTGTASTTAALTITDTLPSGMSYVSGTGTGWTCSAPVATPQVVTCTHANTTPVVAGDSTKVTLTLGIAAAALPGQTNKAYLAGGGQLTVVSAADPTVVSSVGVAVTPDAGAASQLPSNGTSYTQSFVVTNSGGAADVFTLAASVAPGTVLGIISVNGTAGVSGSVSVAAGATATVPVVYTVANAAAAGATDTLKLLATSNANPAFGDPGNVVVTVVRAGLTIAKQLYRDDRTTVIAPTGQVSPGEFVQFKVTVTATGTSGSTLVHVTDLVPAAVTYDATAADGSGWTLSQAGGTVTADLAGTLASGQSRFFWVRVQVQ
jgi:uncharacterized repeat protein (TIGR01451 family)